MTIINQAYINALLADATYALDDRVTRGMTGIRLEEFLNERMTPTQAEYIGNNFTVIDHVESDDLYDRKTMPPIILFLFGSGTNVSPEPTPMPSSLFCAVERYIRSNTDSTNQPPGTSVLLIYIER